MLGALAPREDEQVPRLVHVRGVPHARRHQDALASLQSVIETETIDVPSASVPEATTAGSVPEAMAALSAETVVADPDAFLKFYVNRIGQVLNDPPAIQVLRSH